MNGTWQRFQQQLGGSPGLCRSCIHARLVTSNRERLFLLCEAHRANPRLAKYPSLPVLACESYELQTRPSTEGAGENLIL